MIFLGSQNVAHLIGYASIQCREYTNAAHSLGTSNTSRLRCCRAQTSPHLTSPLQFDIPNPHLEKIYSWSSSSPSYCTGWGKLNSSPQQVSLKENATLPPLPVERKTDRQRSEPVTTKPQDYEWLKSWRISRVIPKDWPFKKQKKHQKRCNSSSAILPL